MNNTNLVVVHNPFERRDQDVRPLVLGERPTIECLLSEYLPNAPEICVSINGEVITREEWGTRELLVGEQMVVVPYVQKSKILSAVLMIVVAIYAPYLVNFLGGSGFVAASAGTFAATGWGIAATIGVSMLGSMLINALLPPPKPSLPGLQSYDNSQTYGWQPVTTQVSGAPIPRAYGRLKLYGNIIAGYIESTGDNGRQQYANMLIELGMGPYSALTDFKINDQPIANFNGVEVVTRLGNVDQTIIPAFDDTLTVRSMSVKVVQGTPYIYTTPGSAYDGLEVVITFPQGLFYSNDKGGLDAYTVSFKVEISADAGATWQAFSHFGGTVSGASTTRWSFGRWVDVDGTELGFEDQIWSEYTAGSSVRSDHTEGEIDGSVAFKSLRFWRWIDVASEIILAPSESTTVTANSAQPIRKTYRVNNLTQGTTYKVRITNNTTDQTSARYGDDLYLTAVNEIAYDDFQYPRSVLAAVRALGTDQLSGSIKFSCIADTAIIRVWNGSAWSSVYNNNPAWVTWDILTQPVIKNDLTVARYDGFDPSRLDLVSFYAWAQWCDTLVPAPVSGTEKRCVFDGTFESPMSMWESALEVCATARAQLYLRGTKVCVVYDYLRTAPTQLFSVGNTSVNGFHEVFLPMADRAASMEIAYLDMAQDYARDSLKIVSPNVTESASQAVSTALRGVVRTSQIWREAMYRLAKNELLKRSGEISVDIDSLACTVGDLVWIQSDLTLWGEGGRAASGSTTTTLELDHTIVLESGKTYELTVRAIDDTISQKRTVTNAAGSYTSLTVSVAFASVPDLYDVWAVGEVNKSVKEVLITELSRNGDQQVRLGWIEYNASIHNVDTLTPTIPTPNVSATTGSALTGLTLVEGATENPDGSIDIFIDLAFTALRPEVFASADIFMGVGSSVLSKIRTTNGNVYRVTNLTRATLYTFIVVATDRLGITEPFTLGVSNSLTTSNYPLIGQISGTNLVANTDFNYQTASLPDGFAIYNNGGITTTLTNVAGFTGGNSFSIRADSAHAATQWGVYSSTTFTVNGITGGVSGGWLSNRSYVITFYAKRVVVGAGGVDFTPQLQWNTSPAETTWLSQPVLTSSYQRYVARIAWGVAVEANGQFFINASGSSAIVVNDEIAIDRVQIQLGDVATEWGPETASTMSTLVAAIAAVASDNVLSAGEKPAIKLDYDTIIAEKAGLDAQATSYGITTEKTTYDTAVSALTTYITGLSPAYTSLTTDTVIVGTTFRTKFGDVLVSKQALIDKIVATAKILADNAQGQANTATTNAATAQTTANTAVTNAATAQTAANTANTALANIASDSILSPSEKPAVKLDYDSIIAEQTGIDAQATAYSITTEKTTYDTAVSALTTYLGTLSGWNTIPGSDVTIVGTTFRTKFGDVYTARQALLNAIAAAAKVLANNAQTQANTATTNAATAQTTANTAVTNAATAQADANTANAALANIASDSILSPSEKPAVKLDYDSIIAEQAGIDAQATAYSITTEKTTYDSAVTALTSYITGLSPAYTDFTSDTNIVGTTFRTKFGDVYTAKQALLNKIAQIAGTLATWAGVSSVAVATSQVVNNAITTAGFVAENGYYRYFMAGSFGVSNGTDEYASLTITPVSGDVVLVEASFRIITNDSSNALDYVTLTPKIVCSGDSSATNSAVAALWRVYDGVQYQTHRFALTYTSSGSALTAKLQIRYDIAAFTNSDYAEYTVDQCVVKVFTSRK